GSRGRLRRPTARREARRRATGPLDDATERRLPEKKFTEPVALSSPEPTGFPLPRTALGPGFDLLALRARCKRDSRPRAGRVQVGPRGEARNLRKLLFARPRLAIRALCSKEERRPSGRLENVVRRAGGAFVPRTHWLSASAYCPRARLRPTRAPCSAQAAIYPGTRASFKTVRRRKACTLRTRVLRVAAGVGRRLGRSRWKKRDLG